MIEAIIIDDEKNSREVITELLNEYFANEIHIVGQAENVANSIKEIRNHKPALLFLDIDLPDGTGFDILKAIDHTKIKVIFITAHEEYAIKAIKFSAFDFILKPFNSKELIDTVRKVLDEEEAKNNELRFEAILAAQTKPKLEKIVLKTSDKIYLVKLENIVRCESENNYTVFYLNNGSKIMVSKTIKTYENLFAENDFLRVHQSHLVNLSYVQHFDKQDGGMLVLTGGTEIPVSHQKKHSLLKYFSSLS